MNKENDKTDEDDITKKSYKAEPIIVENLKYLLFSSLGLVIALGVNDVITKIFEKYYKKDFIIPRLTYISILVALTVWLAYIFKHNPNNN